MSPRAEAALALIAAFLWPPSANAGLEIEGRHGDGAGHSWDLLGCSFSGQQGAVPVIAVDPVERQRQRALRFGADWALDPSEEDFAQQVRALTGGGAKVAIEVTGVGQALNQVLDCMAPLGRVALLGCTRDSNFTVDYYHKVHGPGVSHRRPHPWRGPRGTPLRGCGPTGTT